MKIADITEGMRVRIHGAFGGQTSGAGFALGTVLSKPERQPNKKYSVRVLVDTLNRECLVTIGRVEKVVT